MDKIKLLMDIKECYERNENVIAYLKKIDSRDNNTLEDILISYDFQAGTYYQNYYAHLQSYELYHSKISELLNKYINLADKKCSIMEAGIGEATTLGPVLKMLNTSMISEVFGFDISWSRIKYAEKFLTENFGEYEKKIHLFTGDLMNIPVKDNSIDILYTVHSVEPNGGKEKEVLQELYRVAGKYLILFEPAFEFADEKSKERMKRNGYVTQLYKTAIELGYDVKSYELLGVSLNPENPTGVMVIKINESNPLVEKNMKFEDVICCPVSKKNISIYQDTMYCESSMLAYPIVLGIPCLLADNAIITTKFSDFI